MKLRRYVVTGANRETGESVQMRVSAEGSQHAERAANERGFLVGKVVEDDRVSIPLVIAASVVGILLVTSVVFGFVRLSRTPPDSADIFRSQDSQDYSPDTPAAFALFKLAFDELNARVSRRGGVVFFTDAVYMGDGIVNVTATELWLRGSHEDRSSNLQTIYDLWKAAEGTGLPVFVNIVDESGNIVMSKGL